MAALAGNERFAYDSYRRLISMFGRTVKGINGRLFEAILDEYKAKTEGGRDTDLTVSMLKEIVNDYKALYKRELGEEFPDDGEQLRQGSRRCSAHGSAPTPLPIAGITTSPTTGAPA